MTEDFAAGPEIKKRKLNDECLDNWLKELWENAAPIEPNENSMREPKKLKINSDVSGMSGTFLTYENFNYNTDYQARDFEMEFDHELLDT